MYVEIAVIAALILGYSLIAEELERHIVNGPVLFLLFGLALGPAGLGVIALEDGADTETLIVLAEMTLALVLFTDAANANLRVVSGAASIPARMLLLALPLTIGLGFLVCHWLLPDESLWSVAVMAAVLAPTDAALGKAVVSSDVVPQRIRESLNIESGLNDGLCVPVVFVLASLSIGVGADETAGGLVARYVLEQLGIGVLVGGMAGFVVYLLRWAYAAHWLGGRAAAGALRNRASARRERLRRSVRWRSHDQLARGEGRSENRTHRGGGGHW
jgi:NhaP-type Na+/H+ or K+/H+ antiporter